MTITRISAVEVITSTLSELGVLQKWIDNQHENFNVQVEHKTSIVSISSVKPNLEVWNFTDNFYKLDSGL